jgi:O-antigen/teichoic acid export membrane protein
LKADVASVRSSVLGKDTLWVALGQVLRLGIQALYFVLVARALGSREYGAFVGVVAVVALAAPFASMGTGNLLIKHVARDPDSFPRYWGKALVTTLLSGTLLLGLVAVVGSAWLTSSVPRSLVLLIGAADLLCVRFLDISAQAYQACQWMSRTALLQLLLSPLRLIAVGSLVAVIPNPSAVQLGLAYLLSAFVGAMIAVFMVSRELGAPRAQIRNLHSELVEGALFAITLSGQSSTNDIDKAMLARLGTLAATGVYGAAYRLVDLAFLPVGSLLVATYARFFQHGVHGIPATAGYARRFLRLGVGYGVVTAAALYLLAPVVPSILGEEYNQAIAAIRCLAVLPLLKVVHYFGADALTGAGYQGARTVIMITIALINVLLNAWLIPLYSWRGAASATIISDGLLGATIWMTLHFLGREGRHPIKVAEETPSRIRVG